MKIFMSLIISLFCFNSFSMDPKSAYQMVLKGEAVLIDVREVTELKEGMIDNAMWFPKSQMVPGSDIMNDFKAASKNKKVFVYCQAGKRAEVCKELLKSEGIDAESIGGFNKLKSVLPTKSLYQRVNDPYTEKEAFQQTKK